MSKFINMDGEEGDAPSSSKIQVSVFSIEKEGITNEDVDTWLSQMVKEVYHVVRTNSLNDRDIKIDITLNEKGNAAHLRH